MTDPTRYALVALIFISFSLLASGHGLVPSEEQHGHDGADKKPEPDVEPPTDDPTVRDWTGLVTLGILGFAVVSFYQLDPDSDTRDRTEGGTDG